MKSSALWQSLIYIPYIVTVSSGTDEVNGLPLTTDLWEVN